MHQIEINDRLDSFRILGVAAHGAMAAVYRAVDVHTGELVAIKVPRPEFECDRVFFERFHREEEIGTQMDHPGVVKVFRQESKCRVYLVMEWIEGRLLRDLIHENGALPPLRAQRIASGICEALDHIHNHGVVHRDLKPENIMVDADDRVKLIDFGLASKGGARRLTFGKFSQLMGTAEYVSPEQVKGGRGDARSDVYALGAMLYEMLTGVTPFHGTNPLIVMNARLISRPAPVRDHDPSISPELEAVVMRALEREPEYRYASAAAFARALENPEQSLLEEPARVLAANGVFRGRRVLYSLLAAIPAVATVLRVMSGQD